MIDHLALTIFTFELGARLYAFGWRFFKDPWNVFDFVIVAVALIPAAGPLSVLRSLRILRALPGVAGRRAGTAFRCSDSDVTAVGC